MKNKWLIRFLLKEAAVLLKIGGHSLAISSWLHLKHEVALIPLLSALSSRDYVLLVMGFYIVSIMLMMIDRKIQK